MDLISPENDFVNQNEVLRILVDSTCFIVYTLKVGIYFDKWRLIYDVRLQSVSFFRPFRVIFQLYPSMIECLQFVNAWRLQLSQLFHVRNWQSILLWLSLDDFTREGKPSCWERVKVGLETKS